MSTEENIANAKEAVIRPDWAKSADWPHTVSTREQLDTVLEEAERSGVSTRAIPEIIAAARAKYAPRG